jgi:DNA-directed RNA polymerase specialized sigma24 family protein
MKHIDNEAYGYQQLLDEINLEESNIKKQVRFMLVGIMASNEFSKQEYEVFMERTLYSRSFKDISLTLRIEESTARVYFHRASKKLKKTAIIVESKFLRK